MRSKRLREGTKFDAGKNRTDLIPAEALEELAKVYTVGAKKYADHNWARGIDWSRVYGALLRHAFAFWRGEENDPETNCPHIIQAAWNCIALYMYGKYRRDYDDRYLWRASSTPRVRRSSAKYRPGKARVRRANRHRRRVGVVGR